MNKTAMICGTAILVSLVIGVGFLAFHGTVTGAELLTFFGPLVGIAGGAFAVHAGVGAGASAASPAPTPSAAPPAPSAPVVPASDPVPTAATADTPTKANRR